MHQKIKFLVIASITTLLVSGGVLGIHTPISHAQTTSFSSSQQTDRQGNTPTVSTSNGFVPLAPIPGLTDGVVANSTGLIMFLNNLYKYLVGLAAILAVFEIIAGGLEIATQDIPTRKSDGKKRIYNAIWGLVLVLSPVIVFYAINPNILDLSVNIPPLPTPSGAPGSNDGTVEDTEAPTYTTPSQIQNLTETNTQNLSPAQQIQHQGNSAGEQ